MTPLERRIKAAAIWTIRRVKPWERETTATILRFVSVCDDAFDFVTYNKKTQEYSVEYEVGKGKMFNLIPESKSGFFDKTETRTITFKLN